MQRLRNILAITAVRLSIVYTLIFSVVAVCIVFYMTASTAGIIRSQIQDSINREVRELASLYEIGGVNAVMLRLERSAAAPSANLYVAADPAGRIFAGNVRGLQPGVIERDGWSRRAFEYSRFETGDAKYRAIARVIELPNRMRLLVGRDLGEPEQFRTVIGRALILSIAAMVLVGLLTWALVGRRALTRLESVSQSTTRILAGDRSERLPVSGVGDEFDRLSTRLNAMLDRINLLDDGLRQVSDNIAHDLKTPLTRLRNKADAALGVAETEIERAALQEIIADSDQIIRTFNALLMISRVESGSSAAELAAQDLSAIVGDVAELYEPVAEHEGFAFSADIAEGIVVRGNRELLAQAISNLVDNAIKYGRSTDGAGSISVTLGAQGATAQIAVFDNGPGIAAEERDKVTERFARLEKSRTMPGNGLGLSMVRAVARMHSGTLEFSDNAPGLRATIRLPLMARGPVEGRSA